MAPSKRGNPSEADEAVASKSAIAPAVGDRTTEEGADEGMGEFEDQWEDDLEEDGDEGEVVDAAEHEDTDMDDEEEGDEDEPEALEEDTRSPSPIPFLPTGVLGPDEFLQPDLSTYPLLHSFVPTWPSLSFDILRDGSGEERRGYPVSCALVAGTQAQDHTGNEITIMRWEGLGRTRKEEGGSFCVPYHIATRTDTHNDRLGRR